MRAAIWKRLDGMNGPVVVIDGLDSGKNTSGAEDASEEGLERLDLHDCVWIGLYFRLNCFETE